MNTHSIHLQVLSNISLMVIGNAYHIVLENLLPKISTATTGQPLGTAECSEAPSLICPIPTMWATEVPQGSRASPT